MTGPNNQRHLRNIAVFGLFVLWMPLVAAAQNWNESFDAGQTIALADITSGANPLTSITGALIAQWDATDMYCIAIQDLNSFQAYLNCAILDDRDLWLFDDNGFGIALDDGCIAGVTMLSGQFGSTSGFYYLAVTADGSEAQSSTGSIWDPAIVSGERAPDGPGAANPLTMWIDGSEVLTSPYTVYLSGAQVCDGTVARETVNWGSVKSTYR